MAPLIPFRDAYLDAASIQAVIRQRNVMYDTDSVTIEFASGAHFTTSLRPNWDERKALEATLPPPPTVRRYVPPPRFAGKRKLAAWRVAEDEREMQNAAYRLWEEDRNALITNFADEQYAFLLRSIAVAA